MNKEQPVNEAAKQQQLGNFTVEHTGKDLTTNQGVKLSNTDDSLKVGNRGSNPNGGFSFQGKNDSF